MVDADPEVQRKRLVDLDPAPYNPRKIKDTALEGLGTSIEEFGLLSHIVWNKRSGNIVGGHQRYRKLVEMGETETDVVVVDLDHDDEVSLNLLLNNPYARGEFTSDAKVMLEKVEVQIGSLFNDLRLNDLHEQISKAAKGGDKSPGSGGGGDGGPPPAPPEEDACIVCPWCKGVWRMSDEEVLSNGEEDGENVAN